MEFHCKYCDRIFNKIGPLHFHENKCYNNPNRTKAWNYGLTKETDERIMKYTNTRIENIKSGDIVNLNKGLTKESDKRIMKYAIKTSKTINSKISTNDWHNSFSKTRTQRYKGINMMGNWEVEFAKLLDKRNILWKYTEDKFDYLFNDSLHKYNPDFYLPEYNLYIEIKGYPTLKDFSKWKSITNLNIYFGDDLLKLGINIDVKLKSYNNIPLNFRIKNLDLWNKLMGL